MDAATKLRNAVVRARGVLKDFHVVPDANRWPLKLRTVAHGNYAPPAHIVALLVFAVLELDDLGSLDKIRWQALFEFRGAIFLIRDYKFGSWSLESEASDDATHALIDEIKGLLRRASKPADELLQDILHREILRSNYHLNNVYYKLQSMHEFFRRRVRTTVRLQSRPLDLSRPGTTHQTLQLNADYRR